MRDALLDIALDLTASLSTEARYQRLTSAIRRVVPCDASALLRFEDGVLVPVAVEGLAPEVLGQRFVPAQHPRLARILESSRPVRFRADDALPDPYDGLVEHQEHLDVHACMGCSLRVGGDLVGALTVDALVPGAFDAIDDTMFETLAALAAAAIRTASLIDTLERTAAHRGMVAQQLVSEALEHRGGELIGASAAMEKVRTELQMVAGSDLTVLVTGETGVGKELVARQLHALSGRAEQPLVHVNCAALPESIAESELFGHVKGAFTGAHADRAGKLELADGGTLFLDEIGELPLSIQPKLLRALQFGELARVGADRERRVDVRVIAATNRDLPEEVRVGRFRADLYHRLSVFPIAVPPLRERRDDVALLAGFLLDRVRLQLGLGAIRLSAAARSALERYDWPGNVRELDHVLSRAALRASGGVKRQRVLIEPEHLALVASAAPVAAMAWRARGGVPSGTLRDATLDFQRTLVRRAVEAAEGNWAAAARRLGLDRGNMHRLARRLGLTTRER
jgi:anaerobic nitric oxide reductase transcription regulator